MLSNVFAGKVSREFGNNLLAHEVMESGCHAAGITEIQGWQ